MTDAGLVAVTAIVVTFINIVFLWLNGYATRRHEKRMQREGRVEETYLTFATFMHRAAAQAEHIASPPPFPIEAPDQIADRELSEAVGRVKVFASDAVRAAADRWADAHGAFALAAVGGHGLSGLVAEMRAREADVLEVMRRELSA
jgi:hypothetical protein